MSRGRCWSGANDRAGSSMRWRFEGCGGWVMWSRGARGRSRRRDRGRSRFRSGSGAEGVKQQKTHLYNPVTQRLPSLAW